MIRRGDGGELPGSRRSLKLTKHVVMAAKTMLGPAVWLMAECQEVWTMEVERAREAGEHGEQSEPS